MADAKISALPASTTPLAGTEVLPVVQSSTTKQVAVSDLTAGRAVSGASFTPTGSSIPAAGVYSPGANIVSIATSSLERLRVGSGGNTSIVGGASGLALAFSNTGSNSGARTAFSINYSSASYSGSAIKGQITTAFDDSLALEFYSGASVKRMTIGAGGDVTLNTGNIVQGTAAKGVNFTANTPAAGMTSQLLNWYEEGTWTPVLDSAVAGSGRATTVTSAKYTRIGNMVSVQCYIKMGTLGTGGSGAWSVKGLPFTSAGSNAYGVANIGYAATLNAAVANLGGYISPSSTTVTITGSTGASTLPYGDLDFATYVKANTEIILNATYYV